DFDDRASAGAVPGEVVQRKTFLRIKEALDAVEGCPQFVVDGNAVQEPIRQTWTCLRGVGERREDGKAFAGLSIVEFSGCHHVAACFVRSQAGEDQFAVDHFGAVEEKVEM